MANKFYGIVGYGHSVEVAKSVWDLQITEKSYYGDVVKNSVRQVEGEPILNDLSVGNSISLLADPYAFEHFFAMKYILWAGTYWTVSEVTELRPRLLVRLGGVYNGPKGISGQPSEGTNS